MPGADMGSRARVAAAGRVRGRARVQAHGLSMYSSRSSSSAHGRGHLNGSGKAKMKMKAGGEEYLTESARLQVVVEAVDCFCSRIPEPSERLALAQVGVEYRVEQTGVQCIA